MARASQTITFTGEPEENKSAASAGGDWLLIRQAKIPLDQELFTPQDLGRMLSQLQAGRSAYTAIQSCPVQRTQTSGGWKGRYLAEVEVHHADGVEYELEITKDGVPLPLLAPMLTRQQRDVRYDVDYNQTQQLGFRPWGNTFRATWHPGVYDDQSRLVIPRPKITEEDGYVYIDRPVFGTFQASGLAEYDTWKVVVEHQLGTKWTGNLWAVARWPAGAERGLQKKAEVELKLPACVAEKFDECALADADADADGEGEGEGEGGYWIVNAYYPDKIVTLSKCRPEVIKTEYGNK